MRKRKEITIGERKITIQELTASQIDRLMAGISPSRKVHPAELLMGGHLPVEAVVESTGMSTEELAGDITPSELREVWDAVIEVNDFFSRMLAGLMAAAERVSAISSSGPSAG